MAPPFRRRKKVVDDSDENDRRPLLPQLQPLRSITSHDHVPRSSLISAVVKCPVDSTVPFSLQRCVAHLRIQKEKNKFHSTAPLRPPIHDCLRLDTSSNPPSAPKSAPSSSSQTRHSREPAAVYQTSAQQPPVLPLPSRWCITLA